MSADPADFAPHAALPPLERTDPGRKRTAYIPDRPPAAAMYGTSDALRDLAEADLRARSALPRPPAGYHWVPLIRLDGPEVETYERWHSTPPEETAIGARLVYRLVRNDR